MARNPLKKKMAQHEIESIVTILADRGFNARIKAVEESLSQLGDQFFNLMVNEADREHLATLPNGWMPEVTSLCVRLRDEAGEVAKRTISEFGPSHRDSLYEHRTSPSRSDLGLKLTESKRVPYAMYRYTHLDLISNHELVEQYIVLTDALADVKEERYHFKRDTRQMLNSLGTWEKLYINWPHVKPLIEHLEPVASTPAALPPATKFEVMNNLLGLPEQATA